MTVTDGGVRSIRLHRVNGRTTDHDPRMVTRVHITHRGWCYEDRDDPDVRAGRGSATLRLQVAGLRFISRSTGLDSEELDRVQRSWRTICPKAAIDTKRIPGQFAGYSY
ncbi:hypothetical protein [Thermomonospora echinospora]|uniref:hypothetical protein n=1 Tax=Thermomonospora echinospora TaxID=1992 RepID=UPI0011B04A08|nr:hypothetical protein [Thermomonospora echinospora]